MNKAIVTGSTGLIASGVVECLLKNNIEVLALSRKGLTDSRIQHVSDHPKLTSLELEMSEIERLPQRLKEINWSPGSDCVFYHFAWSGDSRLADGSIQDQFNNVTYSSNAVVTAKELECVKFINAGSQEEKFMDRYLESHWTEQAYHSNMHVYGSAKVSARDMCLLLAYLNKIDYVHTRISVILEDGLETNNYVNSVLRKILNQEEFEAPLNKQLFDFIPKEECAQAYYLLGQNGKNKSDYLVGTGNPKSMNEFFTEFAAKVNGTKTDTTNKTASNELILTKEDFDIADLINDTGFTPDSSNFNPTIQ